MDVSKLLHLWRTLPLSLCSVGGLLGLQRLGKPGFKITLAFSLDRQASTMGSASHLVSWAATAATRRAMGRKNFILTEELVSDVETRGELRLLWSYVGIRDPRTTGVYGDPNE